MRTKRKKKNECKSPASTKSPPRLSREHIITVMTNVGRPVYLRELLHLLHVSPKGKKTARNLVQELVAEGRIVHIKGHRYGLSELMRLVTGKLIVHPDGFGFVHPDEPGQEDIFIPSRGLKGATHGDKVVARIEKTKGRRREGSILRIVERGIKKVVGTFYRRKNISVVIPEDDRLLFEVLIPKRYTGRARTGQIVVAQIDTFPREGRNPEGRVEEVLGDPDDMKVQTRIVMHKFELPHVFPQDVLSHANELPSRVTPQDLRGRKDLRNIPFVTIDGKDARDFDDAVFVKKTKSGYVLDVAIADVSHYVKPKSLLDNEALARGTSVYFPNAVIPMLPEKLSNNLCSLVPGEDRLAVVIRITFDKAANPKRASFFKAVIRSHKRFTYHEVKQILAGEDADLINQNRAFLQHLEWMSELADALHEQRRKRGSIDFDLPEPYVILGLTGTLEDIVRRERNLAHQIIEEFMIGANEAVARFLSERSVPTLYRIHGEPDAEKLKSFVEFVQSLGLNIKTPEKITPKWCQRIIQQVSGKPQEYIVNTILLRTMQQAVYSPENSGHFGLASPTYLHFTSPIRRYPDLIVHRILKGNLRKGRKKPVYEYKKLEEAGQQCSVRERAAMEAEREMLDRLKVRFMADKIGETFEGIVSAVTSFGFFVELKHIFIEGAVRLVDMADDYYEVDLNRHMLIGKRTGWTFQIGQEIKVRVKAVNISRRHINLEVVEEGRP